MADEARPEAGGDQDRPAFARGFPTHPALDALVAAYQAGNFAAVREGAAKIEASDAPSEVKAAARTLTERTRPDPLATLLLVLTAVLLVTLAGFWIAHDGPRSPP